MKKVLSILGLVLVLTGCSIGEDMNNTPTKQVETYLNNYQTNSYTFEILDRIGAGDCYDAGIIHLLNKDINNIKEALNFGIRCDILKHFVKGDVLSISEQEVLNYNPIHQDVKR